MNKGRVINTDEAVRAAFAGDSVAAVTLRIQRYCEDIAELFRPGVKITVLVRSPSHPKGERDVVVTNDGLDDAVRALELRRGLGT